MSSSEHARRGRRGRALPVEPAGSLHAAATGRLSRRRVLRTGLHAGVALGVLATTAGLAGCGFELRRPPGLPFTRIALAGFQVRSPMAAELRRQLTPRADLVTDPARAEVVLHAVEDRRERSVVASTAAAQVRELQLRVRFGFRAETPGGRELIPPAELLLARDLSYRETAALAKAEEEAELFRAMEADVATQVLRRLAAISF
jgi:LPS-assembly lipoprotein